MSSASVHLANNMALLKVATSLSIHQLPKTFSFSRFLDDIAQDIHSKLGIGELSRAIYEQRALLDPVHTITLALNEECRGINRGACYHLPLRQDLDYGHPCDFVFIDKVWSTPDCESWDGMSWTERLELCSSDGRLNGSDYVIPICARLLAFDRDDGDLDGEQSCGQNVMDTDFEEDFSTSLSSSYQSSTTCRSAATPSSPDPAIKPNSLAYSRPIEDVSSYLIHYPSLGFKPFICRTGAAEHKSLCQRFPTPGDISETFIRNTHFEILLELCNSTRAQTVYKEIAAQAARCVLDGGAENTLDVVVKLLTAWNAGVEYAESSADQFGPVKYMWNELQNRIETDRAFRDIGCMEFWPRP